MTTVLERPAVARTAHPQQHPRPRRRRRSLPVLVPLVVLTELAFGLWMNSRGFRAGDAVSRSVNALLSVQGSDPHLASIGFIWMPFPSLAQLPWVALHPLWPDVVESGFAMTFTTALGAGATAGILLLTARRLGLPRWLGAAFALVVTANPMLFMYGSNGMSEGLAAPFLVGAVCFLTLYWHTGRRGWVAAAGLASALAFGALYEGSVYGAGVFAALAIAVVRRRGTRITIPLGRWRAIGALGLLFALPGVYVALMWIVANAAVMGDPLYFLLSGYSNSEQTGRHSGRAFDAAGDAFLTLSYGVELSWVFLLPVLGILLVRVMDRRWRSWQTLALVLLALVVNFGMLVPLVYLGLSFGVLRFFMYPLYVAAGWGLYELASSSSRARAAVTIMGSWLAAVPLLLSAMASPVLGQEEWRYMRALVTGQDAVAVEYGDGVGRLAPLTNYLEAGPFRRGERVLVDANRGFPIAAQASTHTLRELLVLTPDRDFDRAVRAPREHGIDYLLVPAPDHYPEDAVNQAHPDLYFEGGEGFRLVRTFPITDTMTEGWRVYAVE